MFKVLRYLIEIANVFGINRGNSKVFITALPAYFTPLTIS